MAETTIEETEKLCSGCNVVKPLCAFRKGFGRRCRQCVSEYHKARYHADPERNKQAARRWRKSNPERTKQRAWKYGLRERYGMTTDEYVSLLEQQNGVCAICHRPETYPGRVNLAVDHCHATGVIRGLLCNHCNRAIGFFGENAEVVDRAAEYLRKAQEAIVNG